MESDSDDEVVRHLVMRRSLAQRARRIERRRRKTEARGSERKKRAREQAPRAPRNEEEWGKGDVRRWRLDPYKSPWWKLMQRVGVRDVGTRAFNSFRRKFRLPLVEVEKLVAKAQAEPAWTDKPPGAGNGRGHARHPLIIKVLAALRCLAMLYLAHIAASLGG